MGSVLYTSVDKDYTLDTDPRMGWALYTSVDKDYTLDTGCYCYRKETEPLRKGRYCWLWVNNCRMYQV